MSLRHRLITLGAHVAAPCPHDDKCPLQAPDWCHFTQRLSRLRAHKQLKRANLPFEDEKFSYVALMRSPPLQRPGRVLAQPTVSKAEINVKLCTSSGISNAAVPRRDKTSYQRSKKISWGDAVFDESKRTE
jgi:ribosomal protein RSM22 (predicted rRNA methylase)